METRLKVLTEVERHCRVLPAGPGRLRGCVCGTACCSCTPWARWGRSRIPPRGCQHKDRSGERHLTSVRTRRRPRGGTKPGLCEPPPPPPAYQLITQTAPFGAEDGGGEHILSSRSNKVTCSMSVQARWTRSAPRSPVAPPPPTHGGGGGGNYIDLIQHLTLSLLESHRNYLRYFPSYQSRGPIVGV